MDFEVLSLPVNYPALFPLISIQVPPDGLPHLGSEIALLN